MHRSSLSLIAAEVDVPIHIPQMAAVAAVAAVADCYGLSGSAFPGLNFSGIAGLGSGVYADIITTG